MLDIQPDKQVTDGVVLVNKPQHLSSNAVLQRVKKALRVKKAGHTGTLDPLATGMLVLCFGQATKYASYLLAAKKTYQVTAQLGKKTTTGDAEGEVIATGEVPVLDPCYIQSLFHRFTGKLEQVPSMYSAIKHQGKPLYEFARQGIEIDRKSRQITIHALQLDTFTANTLSFTVECSKGTYIRNLVEDMGEAMGCQAYVSKLHRVRVGDMPSDDMVELFDDRAALAQALHRRILNIDAMLTGFPTLQITARQVDTLYYGQKVSLSDGESFNGLLRLYDENLQFIGLGEQIGDILQAKKLIARPSVRSVV